MSVKVSIISPAYNHSAYIEDCITSVLKQGFQDWEMIIIDDGSSDDTFAIASAWAIKDSRIRTYTQENVGIHRLCETYNKALLMAQGEYIAILECDDVWEPWKLERQVSLMDHSPAVVMTYGRAYQANMDLGRVLGVIPDDKVHPYFNNQPLHSFAKAAILGQIFPPPVTVMIRKTALDVCGGFQQSNGLPLVDTPTFVALSLQGPFCFMDEILGTWRSTPNQVTKTYTAQMTESFYHFALEVCRKFNFPTSVIKAVHHYYQAALIIAYSKSGRYKLVRKEYTCARKDYIHSITLLPIWKEPLWRLRSLIGLLFSVFHRDIEGLARILGKRHY